MVRAVGLLPTVGSGARGLLLAEATDSSANTVRLKTSSISNSVW